MLHITQDTTHSKTDAREHSKHRTAAWPSMSSLRRKIRLAYYLRDNPEGNVHTRNTNDRRDDDTSSDISDSDHSNPSYGAANRYHEPQDSEARVILRDSVMRTSFQLATTYHSMYFEVVWFVHQSTPTVLYLYLYFERVVCCTSFLAVHPFHVFRSSRFHSCTYNQSFYFGTPRSLPNLSYVTGTGVQSALHVVCMSHRKHII